MLVAVSAVFIGVCALVVSLYEVRIMREDQRSSVLPLVELSQSYFSSDRSKNSGNWELLFAAENVGLGPAKIQGFYVRVDGELHPTWDKALRALLNRDERIDYGQSSINGRTIPPERSIRFFELNDTSLSSAIMAEKEIGRLDFEACYCSVFDECWFTTFQRGFGEVEEVGSCPVGGNLFIE